MQHEKNNLYPFCCDFDSEVFASLFDVYAEQRHQTEGFKIVHNFEKQFKQLIKADLFFLTKDCAPAVVRYRNDLVAEAETKYYYLTVLLFIYYVQLIFKALPPKFEVQIFFDFIKSESLETMQPLATKLSDEFLKLIRFLFEDIYFLNNLID